MIEDEDFTAFPDISDAEQDQNEDEDENESDVEKEDTEKSPATSYARLTGTVKRHAVKSPKKKRKDKKKKKKDQ